MVVIKENNDIEKSRIQKKEENKEKSFQSISTVDKKDERKDMKEEDKIKNNSFSWLCPSCLKNTVLDNENLKNHVVKVWWSNDINGKEREEKEKDNEKGKEIEGGFVLGKIISYDMISGKKFLYLHEYFLFHFFLFHFFHFILLYYIIFYFIFFLFPHVTQFEIIIKFLPSLFFHIP